MPWELPTAQHRATISEHLVTPVGGHQLARSVQDSGGALDIRFQPRETTPTLGVPRRRTLNPRHPASACAWSGVVPTCPT